MLKLAAFALVLGLLALAQPVPARTWRIHLDGTGDAPTIQAGIDSAAAGDIVYLAQLGTYTWTSQGASGESMIRLKRDVILRGRGDRMTTIHAQGNGRVVEAVDVGDARLENLAITGGRVVGTMARGAGILSIGDSRLLVFDCGIRSNVAQGVSCAMGGGAYLEGGEVLFGNLGHNSATGDSALGGGAYLVDGAIKDLNVIGNVSSAASAALGGGIFTINTAIDRVGFTENEAVGVVARGGALHMTGGRMEGGGGHLNVAAEGGAAYISQAVLENCLFIEHGLSSTDGAVIESGIDGLPSQVANCTLAGNRARGMLHPPRAVIRLDGGGEVRNTIVAANDGEACLGPVIVTCSDFYANSLGNGIPGVDGGGNFNADPMFCYLAPAGSEFFIRADSPCAPEHHPSGATCGLIGARGIGCITGIERASWGEIKSWYRD